MEVTFAMDNAVGNSQRKRTYRACEPCKRRKKRCTHDATAGMRATDTKQLATPERRNTASRPATDSGPALTPSGQTSVQPYDKLENDGNPSQESVSRGSSPTQTPEQELPSGGAISQSHRFVGDLNPETVFYIQGDSRGRTNQENRSDVGMWVARSKDEDRQGTAESTSLRDKAYLGSDASNAQLLPPLEDQSRLVDIYFSNIQPLLPFLDERSFRKHFSEKSVPTILMKALCLAASKDPAAKPHLRLGRQTYPLSPAQFSHRIHANLSNALNARKGTDRVTMIRCLALMSLHSEGSESAELASLNLMQAIHHTHTIGIHIGREQSPKQDESLTSLFWVLWSLDRLNAAINGRPVVMHDRDIGLKIDDVIQSYDAPFRIWLRLSQHLDSVIELYRPRASASSEFLERDLPSFEEIVEDSGGSGIQQSILASLETFYHAISILSCRLRGINKRYNSRTSYLRQCNSAQQIVSITQLKSNGYLAPLPVVPYAVSLSLSVAYRQLRQSRIATTRELAKEQVIMCAKVLEELSSRWWSASTMAKLARKAVLEIDKAANEGSTKASSTLVSSSLQTRNALNHESVHHNGLSMADQGQSSQVPLRQYGPENSLSNIPTVAANGLADSSLSTNSASIQREYPFDPNASYPTQYLTTTNQAEIENIDAFLGNFLDLQSSRIDENSSLLEYMDGLNQEYLTEMANSTQPPDPSADAGG